MPSAKLSAAELREWKGRSMGMFLYIEAQITVIWSNIMSTTSTNSKQDNIFDCCQGHQFDRILISGNLRSKRKN